VLLTQKIA